MSSDSTTAEPATDSGPSPLRSVHTTNFPAILDQLGCSLLVTTYQAGKLVVVRSDGGVINTHFRAFNKPMGMAVGQGRLAIGTSVDVWEFRNVPAVAARLEPHGKHDACLSAALGTRHRRHSDSRNGVRSRSRVSPKTRIASFGETGPTTTSGSSTLASPASPRTIPTTASPPSGGRSSFRSSRRTTAATSTAWASRTAARRGSPRSAKPTRRAAGAKTRRAAAS